MCVAELIKEQSENLKNCSGGLVKPHRLGDAEHGAVGEEGEEVDQAGEVGASQAVRQEFLVRQIFVNIWPYLSIVVTICWIGTGQPG